VLEAGEGLIHFKSNRKFPMRRLMQKGVGGNGIGAASVG
jgi:hypothetical protein